MRTAEQEENLSEQERLIEKLNELCEKAKLGDNTNYVMCMLINKMLDMMLPENEKKELKDRSRLKKSDSKFLKVAKEKNNSTLKSNMV